MPDGPLDGPADLVLRGRHVTIRGFAHADLPALHHWQHANQRPVYATMSQTFAPTMAELESDFARELAAADRQRFAIETAEERLVGYLLTYDLRDDIRSTYLELMVGDPDSRDGVWGQEAIRLLLEHLFEELGVHRVNVVVSQLQDKVLHDLDELGFRRDGVLRHNEVVDGRYVDHLVLQHARRRAPTAAGARVCVKGERHANRLSDMEPGQTVLAADDDRLYLS